MMSRAQANCRDLDLVDALVSQSDQAVERLPTSIVRALST